jgi:hypothetical protein
MNAGSAAAPKAFGAAAFLPRRKRRRIEDEHDDEDDSQAYLGIWVLA